MDQDELDKFSKDWLFSQEALKKAEDEHEKELKDEEEEENEIDPENKWFN